MSDILLIEGSWQIYFRYIENKYLHLCTIVQKKSIQVTYDLYF